jgi:hypothetical protein
MEQWLVELELKMHITSSLRNKDAPVKGAIVMPVKRSNHLVGHAVDMNLIWRDIIYNSSRMKAFRRLPVAIREFIARIRRHPYLRWGGDFSTPDPVHIDDNLSRRDPELWEAKFVDLFAA